jgi:predicted component of type VI protein secretion system
LTIPPDKRSALKSDTASVSYNQLGKDLVLNETVIEYHSSFEVQLGPLDAEQFARFFPFARDLDEDQIAKFFPFFVAQRAANSPMDKMREMIRAFVGISMTFAIRLRVSAPAVKQAHLGGTWLGYNSWIGEVDQAEDRSDPCFEFAWGGPSWEQ